ncbi:putative sulfate exporter family transporter [Crenalkalicoccus roseus]|uniref:putative sulfate exporter family transporter n=1 Tax=Crenalkalicoccus roseus TaxID=1485588 RepID=UPI0010803F3F|nr:putative sulfate exporter family transporter [Crenalkalicoccus roseus]
MPAAVRPAKIFLAPLLAFAEITEPRSMKQFATARPSSEVVVAAHRLGPGIDVAVVVALAASALAPLVAQVFPMPVLVIALLIGITSNRIASRSAFAPGLTWCVKGLLRVAISLLGVRIAFGDIADLGLSTALLVTAAITLTLISGVWLARIFRLGVGYGALAGAAAPRVAHPWRLRPQWWCRTTRERASM